ncbi:hypothetical protein FVE85_5529 [Porphyridium purpureum]|uniref:Uncharacterized protein n=1 Tax=Porphyridium purpureum TaxID=35688 RepID=A0A5J4Z4R7_PORPP|nr:hypothetical protein FVE85_5529 [Porphyridium purpureum]|eukprot:POR7538..scf295_1
MSASFVWHGLSSRDRWVRGDQRLGARCAHERLEATRPRLDTRTVSKSGALRKRGVVCEQDRRLEEELADFCAKNGLTQGVMPTERQLRGFRAGKELMTQVRDRGGAAIVAQRLRWRWTVRDKEVFPHTFEQLLIELRALLVNEMNMPEPLDGQLFPSKKHIRSLNSSLVARIESLPGSSSETWNRLASSLQMRRFGPVACSIVGASSVAEDQQEAKQRRKPAQALLASRQPAAFRAVLFNVLKQHPRWVLPEHVGQGHVPHGNMRVLLRPSDIRRAKSRALLVELHACGYEQMADSLHMMYHRDFKYLFRLLWVICELSRLVRRTSHAEHSNTENQIPNLTEIKLRAPSGARLVAELKRLGGIRSVCARLGLHSSLEIREPSRGGSSGSCASSLHWGPLGLDLGRDILVASLRFAPISDGLPHMLTSAALRKVGQNVLADSVDRNFGSAAALYDVAPRLGLTFPTDQVVLDTDPWMDAAIERLLLGTEGTAAPVGGTVQQGCAFTATS